MISSEKIKTSNAYKFIKNLKDNGIQYEKALIQAIDDSELRELNYEKGFLGSVVRYVYYGLNEISLMSYDEQESIRATLKSQEYLSRFNFLNSHYGLRKAQLHILVGESGKGKSTLLRSIILDTVHHYNSLVVLSEEDSDSFRYQLNELANNDKQKRNIEEMLQNIKTFSELDTNFNPIRDFNLYFLKIRQFIQTYRIKSLFYDNISTGIFFRRIFFTSECS